MTTKSRLVREPAAQHLGPMELKRCKFCASKALFVVPRTKTNRPNRHLAVVEVARFGIGIRVVVAERPLGPSALPIVAYAQPRKGCAVIAIGN